MGGQVQHGWASVSVNVSLCEEVVSQYDSKGAFTSVIVLVQIVADLCFLWWGPDVPARMKKQGKKETLNG